VNEEAAHVQDEEPAKPEQNQHNSQNQKHEITFFLRNSLPRRARMVSDHMSRDAGDSLLRWGRLVCGNVQVSPILHPAPPLPGDKYAAMNDLSSAVAGKIVITNGLLLKSSF
jgi:hypothetical protein